MLSHHYKKKNRVQISCLVARSVSEMLSLGKNMNNLTWGCWVKKSIFGFWDL